MNERQIRYMLTILREGSISRAAEVLYVSQPSLSQMVRKVESELNAELFVRHTNPIVLTPAGECYMQAARSVLNIEENLTRKISEIRSGVRGTIRLGVPLQRSLQLMPKIFPALHEKYPEVTLKLTETGSDSLETMLLNRQLDLALVTTTAKTNALTYILASREETRLLVAKSTDLAHRIPDGTPISIKEAADEAFIGLKNGHSTRITQERLFANAQIHPQILFETESIEVAKRCVPPCGAVFLCPKVYLDLTPELQETCVSYPVLGIDQERHFYICHRTDQYLPQYAVDLIRILQPKYHRPLSVG